MTHNNLFYRQSFLILTFLAKEKQFFHIFSGIPTFSNIHKGIFAIIVETMMMMMIFFTYGPPLRRSEPLIIIFLHIAIDIHS